MEGVEGEVGEKYHLFYVMDNIEIDSLWILSERQDIGCCGCCKEGNKPEHFLI